MLPHLTVLQRLKPADCQKPSSTINNRLAVLFSTGCQGSDISVDHSGLPTAADKREFALASSLATDADATILVVGMLVLREATDPKFGTSCCEGEGNDRDGCALGASVKTSAIWPALLVSTAGCCDPTNDGWAAVLKFQPYSWPWSIPSPLQPPPQRSRSYW